MRWREVTVATDRDGLDAVADLISNHDAGGVAIEDPELAREYIESGQWDYWDLPPAQTGHILVKAYFPVDDRLKVRAVELRTALEILARETSRQAFIYRELDLEEEAWATAWKAYYKPFRVGRRLVVKPTWEACEMQPEEILIELDPGMAFGTGSHPTTTMCLELLEQHLQPGQKVIDVGTGSGILAIAAARLGASEVVAIDLDPVAVKTARENVELNGVDHLVTVAVGNLLHNQELRADVLVANIIADVIILLAPAAARVLPPGGVLIASGIIAGRLDEVRQSLLAQNLVIGEQLINGEWAAIVSRAGGA